MGRVYFLGSGFSSLAGFPLGNNLLDFVRQQLSTSVELFDKDVYSPVLESVISLYESSGQKYFSKNLELLLTSFSLSLVYNDGEFLDKLKPIYYKFISKSGDKRYFFPKHILGRIVYGIRSAFLNHHIKISDYGKSLPIFDKKICEVYDKFFDMLEEGDTILTLNYDLLCEQGLWNKEKWTFLDGYGFKKDKGNILGIDKMHLYKRPESSEIKIYKLHGSVNWAKDYEQEEIILDGLYYFKGFKGKHTEADKFHADKQMIILPNYVRSFIKQKELLKIWCEAKKLISCCDELYFVGYSLSDIDSSLQYMLYDSISTNQKLDKSKIYVIDNQPTEYTYEFSEKSVRLKFDKFLDGKFTFINKSFEDWINGE